MMMDTNNFTAWMSLAGGLFIAQLLASNEGILLANCG